MTEREKLQVEIYGRRYTLRVMQEERAQVQGIAEHVDVMMHQIGDEQPRLDYRDVAVLAAMNIAEEYYKLQREYEDLVTIVNEER